MTTSGERRTADTEQRTGNPEQRNGRFRTRLARASFSAACVLIGSLAFGAPGAAAQDEVDPPPEVANQAPVVTSPGDLQAERGDNSSLVFTGSDPDGDPVTWSVTGLPPFLFLVPASGAVVGQHTGSGEFEVTAVATDPQGLSSQFTFAWIVNSAPVLSVPEDRDTAVGQNVALQLAATDADGEALSWNAVDLPDGITIDPVTGSVTGSATTAGTSTVSITVTDSFGESDMATFDWNVNDLPLIVTPNARVLLEGTPVTVALTVTNPDLASLVWTATGLPPGLVVSDSGVLTGQPTVPGIYSAAVIAAVDGVESEPLIWRWTVLEDLAAAEITVTCVEGTGLITVDLMNENPTASYFEVDLPGQAIRTATVPALTSVAETYPAQPDGTYAVKVRANSALLIEDHAVVNCGAVALLDAAEQLWADQDNSYEMTYDFIEGEVAYLPGRTVVLNGEVSSGDPVTIEQIFAHIRSNIDAGNDSPVLVFDTRTGVPLEYLFVPGGGFDLLSFDPVEVDGKDVNVLAPTVTCLAGNGRIDVNMVNEADVASTFDVQVGDLPIRSNVVQPNSWWRSPITGRPDGPVDVVVMRDGTVILRETVDVRCDGDQAVSESEVQVFTWCVDGDGFVFAQMANPTAETRSYVVEVDGVRRSTTASAWGAAFRGVSGRPDGIYAVTVEVAGTVISSTLVDVSCWARRLQHWPQSWPRH